MSASSSDSWILIAVTLLVVLLLFYLSKKMICNSYGNSSSQDGPTTSPPSSSATSTSTSFSDYYYVGDDGRSSLDLIDDAAVATSSSSGNSPETTDDLAIDIADSLNYHGDHHCHHHHHHHGHHYSVDNRFLRKNNNSNNNNHGRNNIEFSNSVTCNGRKMSGAVVGRAVPTTGCSSSSSGMSSNNRGIDFSGLSPTSSTVPVATTTTGLQSPMLSPISIIASPDLDRKTMFETQLRNQIAKIVQAEHEIQRLVQLLCPQQRQGMNAEYNGGRLDASRASLLQQLLRYPHLYQSVQEIISSSALATEPTVEPTVDSTTQRFSNDSTDNNNIPSLRENASVNEVTTDTTLDNHGDQDHHQNNVTETSLAGNHLSQRHPCHHQRDHQQQNNNFSDSPSDFRTTLSSVENLPVEQAQPPLSVGVNANSLPLPMACFPRRSYCLCHLCNAATMSMGTRARRILTLQRMLLPLTSFPIIPDENLPVASVPGTFSRSFDPLGCDIQYTRDQQHQSQRQYHPGPQSSFSDYSQQQQPNCDNLYQNQPDDDPPSYETCIRSNKRS